MTAASLLEIVKAAWGWHGIDPVELVEQNRFGNVIVKTSAGHFWRICPEELGARRVAESDTDFKKLRADPEFIRDWTMLALTQRAEEKLGFPGEGRCY